MVKNSQKCKLLAVVSDNRQMIPKKRKKYAKIFFKKSVDKGLISKKKICMDGWVFPFLVRKPRHFSGLAVYVDNAVYF